MTAAQANEHDETSSRILDEAERLFTNSGFEGTSVREITSRAGCNLAAVSYHFGGKQGLYEAVFKRRLSLLREGRIRQIREAREQDGTLEGVLRAFADVFLHGFAASQGGGMVMELFVREMLDPKLPDGMLVSEMIGPVQRVLAEAIREAAPGLGERDAYCSIHSLVGQLIQCLHADRIFGGSGAGLEEFREHVIRFTAAGIRSLCHSDSLP